MFPGIGFDEWMFKNQVTAFIILLLILLLARLVYQLSFWTYIGFILGAAVFSWLAVPFLVFAGIIVKGLIVKWIRGKR